MYDLYRFTMLSGLKHKRMVKEMTPILGSQWKAEIYADRFFSFVRNVGLPSNGNVTPFNPTGRRFRATELDQMAAEYALEKTNDPDSFDRADCQELLDSSSRAAAAGELERSQ